MNRTEIFKKALEKVSQKVPDAFSHNGTIGYHASLGYIFSHKFAKAFWGSEYMGKYQYKPNGSKVYDLNREQYNEPAWQYHLQQMVLEENPFSYLEKFL